MTWRIGQELVCIVLPDEWYCGGGRIASSLPEKNEIYHFAGYAEPFADAQPSIYLSEFPGGWNFESRGFRPPVKTDISIFTSLLETQPQKENV